MSTLELAVTIENKSNYQLTYASSLSPDGELPNTIAAGATVGDLNWSSNWTDISNAVTYQIMDGYQVTFGWTVSMASPDIFSCSLSPDDGTFAVSNSGSGRSDFHANQTYVLTQLH